MDKNRRVVVTGMGAITPIGNSVEEFWSGIKEGKPDSVLSPILILRITVVSWRRK